TYRSLERGHAKEIRLIQLHPGEFDDPINCDIFHAHLTADTKYEALSYAWTTDDGDASFSEVIQCSGRLLDVTNNCFAALRRIRDESISRILWVDAICIDQSNVKERNHQVGFMRDIYSQAEQVDIYLGEDEQYLFMIQLCDPSQLQSVFKCRWFTRVWVIQEYAIANQSIIVSGAVQVSLSGHFLWKIRRACQRRCIEIPAPFYWGPGESRVSCLLDGLQSARGCLSTDPKDKAFAVFGIVEDTAKSMVPIDYSRSVEETFTRIAASIIYRGSDLGLLRYCFPFTKTRRKGLFSF
ncbi:HET-domain-containing protein, partial [Lentithecium fluviatile CBS 122367]